MEKFGGVPRRSWEGEGDIAAEAIGQEALAKADEILGDADFTIAPDTEISKPIQDRRPEDPMALTPDKAKTAEQILNGDPSQNIHYVQERPEKPSLSSVPVQTPLAKATIDMPARPVNTTDTRYDHVGRNFTAPTTSRPTPPPAKPKSFIQRLFGG